MMLSDDILAFNDAKIEKVSVPEWGTFGDKIYVRLMTGAQRDAWEASIYLRNQQAEGSAFDNRRARLVVLCACDDGGVLIFKPEQADALGAKASPAIDRLYAAAAKLNRIGKDDGEVSKN